MYRFVVSTQFSRGGTASWRRLLYGTMSVRRKKVHFSKLCEFPGFLANKSHALCWHVRLRLGCDVARVVMKQIESVPIANYFVTARDLHFQEETLKLSTLSEVFLAERQLAKFHELLILMVATMCSTTRGND